MITREQVADLREGDVVKIARADQPQYPVTGNLFEHDGALYAGPYMLRSPQGHVTAFAEHLTITVVSRAPRPLYVNHPRTEPLMNDVARSASEGDTHRVWIFDGFDWWFPNGDTVVMVTTEDMARPMRLLVDGETGQVVQ